MSNPDILIVGAGIFGCVCAERIASQLGKKVLVIDKRNHIGGNCYSEKHPETGIEYHKYGTHIFHTSSQKVMDYLNQFMELNGYHHQVLTTHKDKVYQMPINLETINSFYDKNLKPYEVEEFLNKKKKEKPQPKNLEEKAISLIGQELYEAFIKGYTEKQWNKDARDLPASIINRLPVRSNYTEDYFHNCRFQGIPKEGYTKIFENLLDHPNIELKLEEDYFERDNEEVELTIYTGPIDRYFDFEYEKLEWRSVRFEEKVENYNDFQGTSVMNYADREIPWTRIHEPKHLHPERDYQKDKTLTIYEYSLENEEDPYYPVNSKENQERYQKYKEKAEKEDKVIFGGRLGTYSYYDMDQVIGQALSIYETEIKKRF